MTRLVPPCSICGYMPKAWIDLAEHILANKDNHYQSMRWARRFKEGVETPEQRNRGRYYKRQYNEKGEAICFMCHRPIGSQDSEHCSC